jgi:hypothetical protein
LAGHRTHHTQAHGIGQAQRIAESQHELALLQLLLYDATVTVAGFMLFPVVWNP